MPLLTPPQPPILHSQFAATLSQCFVFGQRLPQLPQQVARLGGALGR
jgi:hypothetical protein